MRNMYLIIRVTIIDKHRWIVLWDDHTWTEGASEQEALVAGVEAPDER